MIKNHFIKILLNAVFIIDKVGCIVMTSILSLAQPFSGIEALIEQSRYLINSSYFFER